MKSILQTMRVFGEVIAVAAFGASILAVLSFLMAETPEAAVRAGHSPMPVNWQAGVFNHGSHYRWCTISAHPFLFALSLVGLVSSAGLVAYINRRWLVRAETP